MRNHALTLTNRMKGWYQQLLKPWRTPDAVGILPDTEIIARCDPAAAKPMITPFSPKSVKRIETAAGFVPVISYGVSSFGYDIRIKDDLQMFVAGEHVVDPKRPETSLTVPIPLTYDAQTATHYYLLPPERYFLAPTLETFDMPADVLGLCVGKSTYARIGVFLNVTPLEPGWRGELVVEIFNPLKVPVKFYPNEGIGQILFLRGNRVPQNAYGKRSGKYQDQVGVVKARVE